VTFPGQGVPLHDGGGDAALDRAGRSGRGVTVLGEVVYSDTAMVSADVATLDIVRTRLRTSVTREATKGPSYPGVAERRDLRLLAIAPAVGSSRIWSSDLVEHGALVKELNSSPPARRARLSGCITRGRLDREFLVDGQGPDKIRRSC